jgi:pimeloyl-ACP methyl ester carboxylesterase
MVLISIPLSIDNGFLNGDLFIPKNARALIIFAHGSGSGRASPRNQYVGNILIANGFATFLVDLLTLEEQESDRKSQKILDKYPSLTLNKFNIKLLATRLETVTSWLIENVPSVKNLPIGYFGSSTGVAAAIEASVCSAHLDKMYAIVSRGGRPDLASVESIKNVKASTLLIVGSKDSKSVIDLNKMVLKQLKNVKSKELVMIPNAGHLFEEEGSIELVTQESTRWFNEKL